MTPEQQEIRKKLRDRLSKSSAAPTAPGASLSPAVQPVRGGTSDAAPVDPHAPEDLKSLPAWLLWRYEQKQGEKKPRKVPYYVAGGRRSGTQGEPADLNKLATFDAALAVLNRGGFDGLGIAMLPQWGLVGLDFDGCVDEHGVVNRQVEALVTGTYGELSPSGKGVRAFMRGDLLDRKTKADGAFAFGFEVFHAKGFLTVTGRALDVCKLLGDENTLAPLTAAIKEHYEQRFGKPVEHNSERTPDDLDRAAKLHATTLDTVADIRSAVEYLAGKGWAVPEQKWIEVCYALRSLAQAGFEKEAQELWHSFSATDPAQYDYDVAEERWQTREPNSITYASVFHWAKGEGWKNPKSAAAQDYNVLVDRSDTGNANLLVQLADGNLRYVPEKKMWLWWDGDKWIEDVNGVLAQRAALKVAQHYHDKRLELVARADDEALDSGERKRILAAAASLQKWEAQCRNGPALREMQDKAKKFERVQAPFDSLNRDPHLVGVGNGVVDVRTGTRRPAGRDELVTKRCSVPFDPSAKAPRWCRFIDEITGTPLPVKRDSSGQIDPASVGQFKKRPELAAYIQRALGYSLTGSVAEHKFFVPYGPGSNGKNVMLDTVQRIAGDYWVTMAPEALMAVRWECDAERPTPTAASLAGARAAISSESKDGQRLNVALVKRHTGGGYMTARQMRENTFRFEITHKLWLMTNHQPALDHLDDAIRGRLHLIPFDRQWNRPGHPDRDPALPDGDKDLLETLKSEAEGILAWLVAGAVAYNKEGLEPPLEVSSKTRDYFRGQDLLGQWLEGCERCEPRDGQKASALFDAFATWCVVQDEANWSPSTQMAFSIELQRRGVEGARTEAGKVYGLRSSTSDLL